MVPEWCKVAARHSVSEARCTQVPVRSRMTLGRRCQTGKGSTDQQRVNASRTRKSVTRDDIPVLEELCHFTATLPKECWVPFINGGQGFQSDELLPHPCSRV